eukprot:4915877-Prymnesium_polylepis.1
MSHTRSDCRKGVGVGGEGIRAGHGGSTGAVHVSTDGEGTERARVQGPATRQANAVHLKRSAQSNYRHNNMMIGSAAAALCSIVALAVVPVVDCDCVGCGMRHPTRFTRASVWRLLSVCAPGCAWCWSCAMWGVHRSCVGHGRQNDLSSPPAGR